MSELPRKLRWFDGAALLVGSVIGSGIFVVPRLIAARVHEPGLVIAIWAFSGLLVLLTPRAYIYEGVENPRWWHNLKLWAWGVLAIIFTIYYLF